MSNTNKLNKVQRSLQTQMSLNLGYYPIGSLPSRGYHEGCDGSERPEFVAGPMWRPKYLQAQYGIKLPGSVGHTEEAQLPTRFAGVGAATYNSDRELGYDEFARAALETYRDAYNPMPTADVHEFGAFFSAKNFDWLEGQIKKQSGFPMERSGIMDAMFAAYGTIQPRSDMMDLDRRTVFNQSTTNSYVREMNAFVLEHTIEENKQANRQWDFYAAHRNGNLEFPDDLDQDTRSRFTGSFYDMTYMLPDD